MDPQETTQKPLQIFEDAKNLINQQKFDEANKKLQEKGLKTHRLAYVQRARLYLNKSVGGELDDTERLVKALDILGGSTQKGKGRATKEYCKQAISLIKKQCIKSDSFSDDLNGKFYYLIAIILSQGPEGNLAEEIANIFQAAWRGHEQAIETLPRKLRKLVDENNPKEKAVMRALHRETFNLKWENSTLRSKQLLLLARQYIVEHDSLNGDAVYDRLTPYDRTAVKGKLINNYKSIVSTPSSYPDNNLLSQAWTWLTKNELDHEVFSELCSNILKFYRDVKDFDEHLQKFGLRVAQYFFKNIKKKYAFKEYAFTIYQTIMLNGKGACDHEYKQHHERFISLCDDLQHTNIKVKFKKRLEKESSKVETLIYEANQVLSDGKADLKSIKEAIEEKLGMAAEQQEGKRAIDKLKTLEIKKKNKNEDDEESDDENPENTEIRGLELRKAIWASVTLAELLTKKGEQVTKKKVNELPLYYTKDFTPDHRYALARKGYEKLLKEGDIPAHLEVAMMRSQGEYKKVFQQNDFIARKYFEIASKSTEIWSIEEKFCYAVLCFDARGGGLDIEKSELFVDEYKNQEDLSSDQHYFLGNLYYLKFQDSPNDQKSTIWRDCASKHYGMAGEKNHEDGKLSFMIMSEKDELCKESKEKLACLGWQVLEHDPTHDNIAYEYAKQKLEADDARPMRRFAENNKSEEHRQAINDLANFYRKNNTGVFSLITTLCYEHKRHAWESRSCIVLREIIGKLKPDYDEYNYIQFKDILTEQESSDQGDYYDEYPSDDSDIDTENQYQEATHHVTADYEKPESLVGSLDTKQLIKCLDELNHLKPDEVLTNKDYKKKQNKHDRLFRGIRFNPAPADSSAKKNAKILEDLHTLNYHHSKGELPKALELITTQFCVAQTRGIEFRTTAWNKLKRSKYRRDVRDKEHPLHGKILHSFSAHEHAGVDDFTDLSAYTRLKLEKSTHLIRLRLNRLSRLEPHCQEDFSEEFSDVADKMTNIDFTSRLQQIQQLYSLNQQLFYKYLRWECKRPDAVFLNTKNPFVSTGDIVSTHPCKYAYGNKPYKGFEDDRLRPRYNRDGRAKRPYSGAVYLTIHPLADFNTDRSNYIPAMNTTGEITIDNLILAEREQTFLASIASDRVKFIHVARFPSFTQPADQAKTHLHKYGLTEKSYGLFQKLIRGSAPHSSKRKLTKKLLGEYIGAFQTLYIWDYACKRIKQNKQEQTLIYRDRYGNFSLSPQYAIDANPKGDSEDAHLRRMHTHEIRKHKKRKIEPPSGQSSKQHAIDANSNGDNEDAHLRRMHTHEIREHKKRKIETPSGRSSNTGLLKNRAGHDQGYIRNEVSADGDCGYTAFGITRDNAHQLLINQLESIRDILLPGVREALLEVGFYQSLINNEQIPSNIEHAVITENIEQYVGNLRVLRGYLDYDVRDKHIDAGWAHPCILQALAHIQNIALRIWTLGKQDVLIPHRVHHDEDYSVYVPPNAQGRKDLLFINDNHFELLEFSGYENDIPNEGIGPLNSTQCPSNFEHDSYAASGPKYSAQS